MTLKQKGPRISFVGIFYQISFLKFYYIFHSILILVYFFLILYIQDSFPLFYFSEFLFYCHIFFSKNQFYLNEQVGIINHFIPQIGDFTTYKQIFCYLNLVSTASRFPVGTLMTISDVRLNIALRRLHAPQLHAPYFTTPKCSLNSTEYQNDTALQYFDSNISARGYVGYFSS